MPRISDARRGARRAEIVSAARRCFAREGFHQTSMPDIAAEAGIAVGAPYRYFSGKDDLVLEIAGDAFGLIFDPVEHLAGRPDVTVADLVTAAVDPVSEDTTVDAVGAPVPVDELLRCAIQAWGELLRNEALRTSAQAGFDRVRKRIATALRKGKRDGTVRPDLDPDQGARMVIALLHGFVLQRVAFGLDDTAAFRREVRKALAATGIGYEAAAARKVRR